MFFKTSLFMLAKTRGIVLQSIKYGDSSRIVHIYTEKYGKLAFIIKGIRKKSSSGQSVYQPLTLLDMEIYFKPDRNLQHVREVGMNPPFMHISGNIQKIGMVLFLSEILNKALPEEEANPDLFAFLHNAIRSLDEKKNITNYYHLFILVRLIRFLGFAPVNQFSEKNRFLDMREGTFVSFLPAHQDFMDKEDAKLLSSLMNVPVDQLDTLPDIPGSKRGFLEKVLLYYRIHLEGMGKIKSLDILHDVFN